jgi:hypothetical protein
MMDTSSPALLVWMIRTVLAARGNAIKRPKYLGRSPIRIVCIVEKALLNAKRSVLATDAGVKRAGGNGRSFAWRRGMRSVGTENGDDAKGKGVGGDSQSVLGRFRIAETAKVAGRKR